MPQHYSVGEGGYGSRPVYAVTEYGPGVVVATWGERGASAHLSGPGYGAQAVLFVNGPPPGMMTPAPVFRAPVPHDPTPEHFLLLLH